MPNVVLVVDDDDAVRQVLEGILRREGFLVLGAGNAQQALLAFARVSPDLVLTDVCLPDRSGLEVCRRIRAEAPLTPILLLTSGPVTDQEDLVLSAGADDLLMKPFERKELVEKVNSMLGLKAYSEHLQRVAGSARRKGAATSSVPGPQQERDKGAYPGKPAQRFPIHFPVRYRPVGATEWWLGTTENISRSGLLFRAEHAVEPNTKLEMKFLLPATRLDEPPAEVACRARIVRMMPASDTAMTPAMGAKILNYRFQHGHRHAAAPALKG